MKPNSKEAAIRRFPEIRHGMRIALGVLMLAPATSRAASDPSSEAAKAATAAQVPPAPSAASSPATTQRATGQPPSVRSAIVGAETDTLDQGMAGPGARPWAEGVSAERQAVAVARLHEGNASVRESLFRRAAAEYRQALAQWDHPGIHFNLALALLNLDQTLEAHEHLQQALRFGPAPLGVDKYENAMRYLKLVEKQLAAVDIQCSVPGAGVSLDDRPLFRAPGRFRGYLRPGPHTIAASKDGLVPVQRTKVLVAGENAPVSLALYSEQEIIESRRRWPLWKPITVTAAGAAVLAAAVTFTVLGQQRFDEFDRGIQDRAGCSSGCIPPSDLASTKSRGEAFQTTAAILYAAGGATLAGGITLLLLNNRAAPRLEGQERAVSLTPILLPGGGGLWGAARF